VAQTSDGGYIVVSHRKDGATGESAVWLMKLKVTPP